MLSNGYFLAKFRFDTAENEPAKNLQNLLIFPILLTLTPKSVRGAALAASTPLAGPATAAARADPRDFAARTAEDDPRNFAKFRQNVVRIRLYRHRFLQENMRFAAFFEIYQIMQLHILKNGKIFQMFQHLEKKLLNFHENC